VIPWKGHALQIPLGGEGLLGGLRRMVLNSPAPLTELRKALPEASIVFDSGEYPAQAAIQAGRADVAIVFANKFESEGFDSPVPWRGKVKAIVEAWYAGQAGGQPIAEVLAGKVNPSGRLPVTFYAGIHQTPHPKLAGYGTLDTTPITINYHEGAEVGYRWLAKTGQKPNYAFGHGLSYTTFAYKNLRVSSGETVTATFTVTNTGKRAGADVPQVYLTGVGDTKRMRLLGFDRVELQPDESKEVTVTADPRLLARFDGKAQQWRITSGAYKIALAKSAAAPVLTAEAQLSSRLFGI
jgi:beta-glucosidase